MRRGFTLLELILVIAIIVVLAGAMMPVFNITRREAMEAKAKAELDNIKTAALMYRGDTNTWPAVGNVGLGLVNSSNVSGWDGPYLTEWAIDPWGNNYQLNTCGTNRLCANSTNLTNASPISVIITANTTNP